MNITFVALLSYIKAQYWQFPYASFVDCEETEKDGGGGGLRWSKIGKTLNPDLLRFLKLNLDFQTGIQTLVFVKIILSS